MDAWLTARLGAQAISPRCARPSGARWRHDHCVKVPGPQLVQDVGLCVFVEEVLRAIPQDVEDRRLDGDVLSGRFG